MKELEPPDSHHLNAAIGWLGLGCANDAREELAKISRACQQHPSVLETRWLLCVHDERWNDALETARAEIAANPDDAAGWLHRAYALRRVSHGSLSQAWEALLPVAKKFPGESVIAYNLSCYACQMEQLEAAREWLQRALATGEKNTIKKMALADADLQRLWPEIKEL